MDVRPGRAISPPFSALADITYRRVNFDAPATTLTARGTGSVGDVVGGGGRTIPLPHLRVHVPRAAERWPWRPRLLAPRPFRSLTVY